MVIDDLIEVVGAGAQILAESGLEVVVEGVGDMLDFGGNTVEEKAKEAQIKPLGSE